MLQESPRLDAVIFDLDGVITDTSELHYEAWKRLADEENLPFDRERNEALRGVARRASLDLILDGRSESEERIEEMMARKNGYYVDSLATITPANLLPGALELLHDLRRAGVRVALGSASRNAPTVLANLQIADLFDVIADGSLVERAKPAPDLFLKAAELMGVTPAFCAVVEDAEAGIDAALEAGMWSIGVGPVERVGHAHVVIPGLANQTADSLHKLIAEAGWRVSTNGFDPAQLRHHETIFTTGNGAFCVRGALEERIAGDNPACFVHRLWDDMPISFSELASTPRWYGLELWVNGQRFGMQSGSPISQRRELDLRTGVLHRTVRWRPAADGPLLEIHFERFCSRADPHLAVVRVEARVLEGQHVDLRVRSGLDRHVENTGLLHWTLQAQAQDDNSAMLHVRTRATRLDLALAGAVRASGDAQIASSWGDATGQPTVERRTRLAAGQSLLVELYVALVASFDDADPVGAAQRAAREAAEAGYASLRAQSDAEWAALWRSADVIIDGDIEAQTALRFSTFQLAIAAPAHTERASIGAKSLSGFGYRHHVFWDTETFMLPLFSHTLPGLARNMLLYRYHNLAGARAKAAANGYEGAQYPWESAGTGEEVTPPWVPHWANPRELIRIWTGDIEIHITADIAYAILQYWRLTGDDDWMRDYGAEVVLDGAKFWASAARLEADGKRHLRNVIGPDEYHDRIDDNAFTNAFARWHLLAALDLLVWLTENWPVKAAELTQTLNLTEARLAFWREVADTLFLGAVDQSGVIEQFEGYHALEEPDFTLLRSPGRTSSMQALLGIEACTLTQYIKQPDVLMLLYLLPDLFSAEQVAANYAYYDPRTDHEFGSSLGPSISAIMACRTGNAERAYEHFMRAARADLADVRHNADDGIHAASAGGLWQAAVLGFGGLQVEKDGWQVRPSLPPRWSRLAFAIRFKGVLHRVDIRQDGTVSTSAAE